MTNNSLEEVCLIIGEPTLSVLSLASDHGIGTVVLDAEQTGLTPKECGQIVGHLQGSSVSVAVRLPDVEYDSVLSYANTGVDELVLPRLTTVDELEYAFQLTRYPPAGDRPIQTNFSNRYGMDYSRVPVLSVLFETAESVERIEEFVASSCFAGGWIGMTDLRSDLERLGKADKLSEYASRVMKAVGSSGHPIGLPLAHPRDISRTFSSGATRVALYWEKYLRTVFEGIRDRE